MALNASRHWYSPRSLAPALQLPSPHRPTGKVTLSVTNRCGATASVQSPGALPPERLPSVFGDTPGRHLSGGGHRGDGATLGSA